MSTALHLGNEAFRRADYATALGAYARSLGDVPEMAAFTLANIELTRQRQSLQRGSGAPLRVVIVCTDLARHAARVTALAAVYQDAAQVSLVGAGPVPADWRWPVRTLDAVGKGSGAAALAALGGDMPDLLHLVGADEGNQVVAIAARALWRGAVALDLADGAAADSPFWAAVDAVTAAAPGPAGATPVCALPAQAATWLPRLARWRAEPARPLPPPWITLIKQQPVGPGASALRALAGLLGGPVVKIPAQHPAVADLPVLSQPVVVAQAAALKPRPTASVPAVGLAPAVAMPAVATPAPAIVSAPAVRAATLEPPPTLAKGSAATVNLFGLALAELPAEGRADDARLSALLMLVRWRAADLDRAGHPAAASHTGPALRLRLAGTGRLIADIGHLDDQTLRWRIDAEADNAAMPACHVSFLQVDPAGQSVTAVARMRCEGAGPHIADVRLAHPLHPLLVVASDAQDRWLDASLLPFPSLCRGGMHHAELWMTGSGPVSMAELQATSDSLLQELLGQTPQAGALALAALDIDIAGATGAERLLQAPWRKWLAEVMGLTATTAQAGTAAQPEAVREHLSAACAPHAPEALSPAGRRLSQARASGLTLRLPADALPALSVLASRRLTLPADAAGAVGAYALAQMATGRPQTLVSLPPLSAGLLAWQPPGAPLAWPVLTRPGMPLGDIAAAARMVRCELPLAVRLTDRTPSLPSRALLPVPSDRGDALWAASPATSRPVDGDIHALLVLDTWRPEAFARVVGSLRAQTSAAAMRLVVSLPAGMPAGQQQAVAALLQEQWPQRHRLIASREARRTARVNEAAEGAHGFLLMLDEETVLHDTRTAQALRQLAAQPGVASAACVLVREVPAKKGSDIAYLSGGLFPAHLSFNTRVSLVLEEVVTRHAFPLATYPVLANSFRLAMVATEVWHQLGGLDADRHPMHHADIDFGLRAAAHALQHLCTSVLTASSFSPPVTTAHVDTQSLRLLPLACWHAALDHATLLRELGA